MSARPEDIDARLMQAISYTLGVHVTLDDAAKVRAALTTAGFVVVPVGSECPFDRMDNGGLAPEDPCPICGDLGTFSEEGEDDPPSRCISNRRPLPQPPKETGDE
jgi:hypothetical protein